MSSPLSPQVNLVSSAMTPIRVQENNMHLALDTITLVGAACKNEIQDGEA